MKFKLPTVLHSFSILFGICFLLASYAPYIQASPVIAEKEYKIETAFIYQFTNYINWPQGPQVPAIENSSFVISVVGVSPVTRELEELAKIKTVKGQKIVIHQATEIVHLKKSHIIIIFGSNEKTLEEVSKKVKGSGTLIISFSKGFAEKGAMINFYIDEGRLRFEINRSAIESEKLQVSSQLLKLAKLVD